MCCEINFWLLINRFVGYLVSHFYQSQYYATRDDSESITASFTVRQRVHTSPEAMNKKLEKVDVAYVFHAITFHTM